MYKKLYKNSFLFLTAISLLACSGKDEVTENNNEETGLTGSPQARSGHGMVYDEVNERVLLFGGGGSVNYADLWSYNGSQWTALTSSGGPSARNDLSLAYDTQRNKLILWGGRSGSTSYRQTWEWSNSGGWTLVSSSGPENRIHAALCYDEVSGKTLLFGGVGDNSTFNDTWLWDGQSWTLANSTGPANRAVNGIIFHEGRQKIIMICTDLTGSQNADGTRNSDMWEWSGTAWNKIGDAPPCSPSINFAAFGNELVWFIGSGPNNAQPATWFWRNETWSLYSGANPNGRNGHSAVYE